jgi:hypothetical protein
MNPLFFQKHARVIVLVSFVVSFLSLFLPWDTGSVLNRSVGSSNAFKTGYWLYILLVVYPAYCVFKKVEDIKVLPGIFLPYLAVILPFIFYPSGTLTSTYSGTQSVNYSGVGTYLFALSTFILAPTTTIYYKQKVDAVVSKLKG